MLREVMVRDDFEYREHIKTHNNVYICHGMYIN